MNNTEFKNTYVNYFNLMRSGENHYFAIINEDFNYIAISDGAAKLLKLNATQHIGMNFITDINRPEWIQNKKSQILSKITSTNSPNAYVAVTPSDEFLLDTALIWINPIKNPTTNEIVAYELSGSELNHFQSVYIEAINQSAKPNSIFKTLTPHELNILYFKCLRYSDSQLVDIFKQLYNHQISAKTINNILRQQLYLKFDVVCLQGLIEKSQQLGILELNLLEVTQKDTIIELSDSLFNTSYLNNPS